MCHSPNTSLSENHLVSAYFGYSLRRSEDRHGNRHITLVQHCCSFGDDVTPPMTGFLVVGVLFRHPRDQVSVHGKGRSMSLVTTSVPSCSLHHSVSIRGGEGCSGQGNQPAA